jgi:protein-S-isoprenylcysteine O-methyltransferase Ste14
MALASLGFWTWTHLSLGTLWTANLQIRANHYLVETGPYSRIRHPMYTAIMAWAVSLGFMLANWVPIVFAGVVMIMLTARVPREEKMMIERFGEEYRAYMKRTGRFLPKFRGRAMPPAAALPTA